MAGSSSVCNNLFEEIMAQKNEEIITSGEELFDLLDSDWEGYEDERFEEVDYEAGANYE